MKSEHAPESLVPVTNNTNYNASPDQFEKVVAELPEAQQDVLRWWYFLGKEQSWPMTKLAKACGVHSTTLSRIFRGEYGADVASVCESLDKARTNFRETADNPDFIMTSLAKQIFAICDSTRALRTVAIVQGEMGIGKTTVEEEYKRRNNHGRTSYYRCEPGLTLVQFVTEFARANGVSTKNKQTHLRLREKLYTVAGAGNRLLIVDELHQLFLRRDRNDITPILQCEFLRAVYDKANCGMVLFGTTGLEKYMANESDALAQLLDRGRKLYLPSKPTKDDVRAFISHYGLPDLTSAQPEASAIMADIVASSGLRQLTLHLRNGATLAAKRKEPFTWDHFVRAFKDLASLGKKPGK